MKYSIGIDIGGTNTDAVLVSRKAGQSTPTIISAHKTATTQQIGQGIENVVSQLLEQSSVNRDEIGDVYVGTTHATNAILQNQGLYRVGVIRLAGHRPQTIPPCYKWPQLLIKSIIAKTMTISGGFECHGAPITPLDKNEARNAIEELLAAGAESIALIGVFSPMNGEQESAVADLVYEMTQGQIPVTMSHKIGGIGFIERENSTILNSALKKVMSYGFQELQQAILRCGIAASLHISQNNGSVIELKQALEMPILTMSAGPTNSFMGGARLCGFSDAVIVDIGGTSTDVGVVHNGFARRCMNQSNIGGITLNASMPDVLSVALGGGSHIQFNSDESIRIGPHSSARKIFQDAISFGGQQLTLTDIALKLGSVSIPNTNPHKVELSQIECESVFQNVMQQINRLVTLIQGKYVDLPIVLVGGGASLIPKKHLSQRFYIPHHAGMANAYGATLAEISGTVDTLVSLTDRDKTLDELKQQAIEQAIRSGASKETTRIVEVDIMPYHYVPNHMARVLVVASGQP